VKTLIMFLLCQNKPAGDPHGPCGRPGGDTWCRIPSTYSSEHLSHTSRNSTWHTSVISQ